MKLSKRLETIASFVHRGSKIADIGTDHGYIPIYLAEKGTAVSAIARDVRTGPLKRAADHVREKGLEEKIDLRLSDGLAELLPGEADTVIMAGMGGGLSIHILEEGRHMWESVKHWLLSPQSDIGEVRHFLADNGFLIERETMVKEEGKYYTVMEVCRGSMIYDRESDYRYGRCLIRDKNPVLAESLGKEKKALEEIGRALAKQQSEKAKKRLIEISEKLELIREVNNEMQ